MKQDKALRAFSKGFSFGINPNRVSVFGGMLHNSDYDLCGTVFKCANRLWVIDTVKIVVVPTLSD